MLRALFGAVLGAMSGWAAVMVVLGYGWAWIPSTSLHFVYAVAIGCGAVAGSVLGATSAVTDAIKARTTEA